ncbi:MAG: sulfotransferase domain-containing protein [Rhodothermales bacterium]
MRPNFFIVGAAKCGTTSLYHYLRQHPEVYMPHSEAQYWKYKEPNYFCRELIAWKGLRIDDEQTYLELFKEAPDVKRVGEASALNLYSKRAAHEIASFCPEAKIIILLRKPADMMRSWHHDCVRWGHETEMNFEKAVALDHKRRAGDGWPKGSGYPSCLVYKDIATFSPQVKRYFDVFGRSNVGVWLLEDLAELPGKTFSEIAHFLGIDTVFQPLFEIHNPKKIITNSDLFSHRIKRFLRHHVCWSRSLKQYIPASLGALYNQGLSKISKSIPVKPIDPAFMDDLTEEMEFEVDALSQLINRDLSHWQHASVASAA